MLLSTITSALFLTSTLASPLLPHRGGKGNRVRTVHQFPNETWVENLAPRSNGKILVTFLLTPEVWEIDPSANPVTAELVHDFGNYTTVSGIAEYAPDCFAVNVGNVSLATGAVPGTMSVWSIDMQDSDCKDGSSQEQQKVHKIADLPDAKFLNGMATLPSDPSTLLLADCTAGQVLRLDTNTGTSSVAIDDPTMKPNASVPLQIGVNGIRFAPGDDGYLYFTNIFHRPVFNRVPVNANGTQAGAVETILESPGNAGGAPDDFALDAQGHAWIADGVEDGLLKVDLSNASKDIVLGGTTKSKVIGLTSAQFGRSKKDIERGTLYITNNGGIAFPPPSGIVGGGLYAIDTAKI